MKQKNQLLIFATFLFFLLSCTSQQNENQEEIIVPKAAVSVTSLQKGNIKDEITLNGKTIYYKKNVEVAPISGYLTKVLVKLGDQVKTGDPLFEIETRENKALQQIGKSNAEYGLLVVPASASGIVNEPVTVGVGAFVVEGTPLCSLVDNNDLLVLVNVPYENHQLVKQGTSCRLVLPDKTKLNGWVHQIRPFVNETSQTQEILIKIKENRQLPENMNLTARFQKSESFETLLLPKKALLANETQDEFWVMKIVQDSIAIKIPVECGIKTDSLIEIKASGLTLNDIIIQEGGYGLEDSSLVNIVK